MDSKRRSMLINMATLGCALAVPAQANRSFPSKKVLVIGAGMAGLAAAQHLARAGFVPIVLEARDRIGGRVFTSTHWSDAPLDLGASWIHGTKGNPLTQLARQTKAKTTTTHYTSTRTFYAPNAPVQDDDLYDEAQQLLDAALNAAKKKPQDMSVQAAVDVYLSNKRISSALRAQLDFVINTTLEQEYAGAAHQLSAKWVDEDDGFSGDDVVFEQGYISIVKPLSQGLDIRLNHVVQRIDYQTDRVKVQTNKGLFEADAVLITVPLGVLKAKAITFEPPLPIPKQQAIDALGMGVLDKLYLRFETAFWKPQSDWLERLSTKTGRWSEWVDFAHVAQKPILLGFNAADDARSVEGLSDAQIIEDAMLTLREMFGADIPAPVDAQVTRWAADPFAFGSYSFNAVGSNASTRKILAQNIAARVFFAGEATGVDHASTVHAAYLSGIRAAKELMAS